MDKPEQRLKTDSPHQSRTLELRAHEVASNGNTTLLLTIVLECVCVCAGGGGGLGEGH